MFQTILRNTQGGTADNIFNILFRQLGSAEEPFCEYEKNFEKRVHSRRRKVRNGDNTNLWTTLIMLLSETMCKSFKPTAVSFRPLIISYQSLKKTSCQLSIKININKKQYDHNSKSINLKTIPKISIPSGNRTLAIRNMS